MSLYLDFCSAELFIAIIQQVVIEVLLKQLFFLHGDYIPCLYFHSKVNELFIEDNLCISLLIDFIKEYLDCSGFLLSNADRFLFRHSKGGGLNEHVTSAFKPNKNPVMI